MAGAPGLPGASLICWSCADTGNQSSSILSDALSEDLSAKQMEAARRMPASRNRRDLNIFNTSNITRHENAAEEALGANDVSGIYNRNCMNCHNCHLGSPVS